MLVRLKEDDLRFELKKGDILEVQPYAFDTSKLTVIRRVSDNFDPRCNVYRSQIEFLKANHKIDDEPAMLKGEEEL